jgi:hypothetical protein
MDKVSLIQYAVLSIIGIFYLVYTIRFVITFREDIIFSRRLKIFHSIMIWVVPFIWIFLLKSLLKSTPDSHKFENKVSPESSTEIGLGLWADIHNN